MSDLFPFTASNGYRMEKRAEAECDVFLLDADGESVFGDPTLFLDRLDAEDMKALREFFQAERDASLGQWRSKEHPDYVVYETGPDDSPISITHEPTGSDWLRSRDPLSNDTPSLVAREFFAAHPEPKPWHNAKPGEAWLITIDGYAHEWAAVVEDSGLFRTKDGQGWTRDHEQITAARPLWPEGGDES